MAESMRILHDDLGRPELDPDESITWLENRVSELFAEGLIWRPGAAELLRAVRAAGIPTALVTATRRRLVEVALHTIGADMFDAVVAGDDLDESKPHPAPYLTAARLVGADAARCVAIEDSPNGIASALAAGCVVLGVPCEVGLGHLDEVTLVDSLADIDVTYLRHLVKARAGVVWTEERSRAGPAASGLRSAATREDVADKGPGPRERRRAPILRPPRAAA
jgi:HAD superfamily hydrolase (TIGR01509 family)